MHIAFITPIYSFTSPYYMYTLKLSPPYRNSYLDSISTSVHCHLYAVHGNYFLLQRTYRFFKRKYKRWLTCGHVMSLQPFWNYVVLIGNCLVIAGSVLKIILANKVRRHHCIFKTI